MGWAPKVAAKQKCKVDKALYRCELCKFLVYEGKSPVTYDYYLQVYGDNVLFDNFHMDHIIPVVATNSDNEDWNAYFDRLFCEEANFQGICKPCHDIKTKAENKQRKLHKQGKNK